MTLKEIKALFAPGQVCKVTREGNRPLVVHGNLGTSIIPAVNGEEIRTLRKAGSKEWVWDRDGKSTAYSTYPKASEVLEARTGFVKFKYDNGTVITIELTP